MPNFASIKTTKYNFDWSKLIASLQNDREFTCFSAQCGIHAELAAMALTYLEPLSGAAMSTEQIIAIREVIKLFDEECKVSMQDLFREHMRECGTCAALLRQLA
ncbi:MAG: hypothetical protein ABIG35_11490 [Pseudomonadota bacterium]